MKYGDLALKKMEEDPVRSPREISLTAHFQPILSLKNRTVVGYEGLIRGVREQEGGLLVPPVSLFETAKAEDRLVEMDRQCRDTILDLFAACPRAEDNFLLFINFESSLLDDLGSQNGYFLNQVARRHINPADVVIEIIESKVARLSNLLRFVEFYRYHGFLIALDDVGVGFSNFDRLAALKPDIIKIDRSIVKNMEKD
ncbi:MAG: EAL domain-containing protein, partial [Deltaproteobacteria bacterium]|nr:EAL domain-containing protein [Deltaproteobacteria bacterium]